jgi:hypothetical protein
MPEGSVVGETGFRRLTLDGHEDCRQMRRPAAACRIEGRNENKLERVEMDIKRSGSRPSGKGPAEYFTGAVRVDPLFEAPEAAEAADIQKSLATKGGCEAALISSDYHWTQQT